MYLSAAKMVMVTRFRVETGRIGFMVLNQGIRVYSCIGDKASILADIGQYWPLHR